MTLNDVAIPDVCVPLCPAPARVRAAVRSLFAFESFAASKSISIRLPFHTLDNDAEQDNDAERTSTLRIRRPRTHFPRPSTNKPHPLRLVERPDFFFRLAESHPVLQLAQLGLGVCFFRFARAVL